MEIIAYLYSKDINKCFDYSYSKINNGVFSEIETPTNLKYCDKKTIKSAGFLCLQLCLFIFIFG